MTAKEKAKELIQKMLDEQSFSEDLYDAKQCAEIAINEIIIELQRLAFDYFLEVDYGIYNYWEEVKQEINKL